ncbi:hypothetical protein FACS1894152_4800 [Bacilli bacterium]|nr:hypothetical protein FACS1894152_4800 [Bacilli bacterium]
MRKGMFFMLMVALSLGCGSVFGEETELWKDRNNPDIRIVRDEESRRLILFFGDAAIKTKPLKIYPNQCLGDFCSEKELVLKEEMTNEELTALLGKSLKFSPKNKEQSEENSKALDESAFSQKRRDKIIFDNSKTAFLNLMESASRNASGRVWLEANYDRLNRSKYDVNGGGFSAGVRVFGDGDTSALHLLLGFHMFSEQNIHEAEGIFHGSKIAIKINMTGAKIISTGLYGKNVVLDDLYLDYALYLGYHMYKIKISVKTDTEHPKVGVKEHSDEKDFSSLNWGTRLGLGYGFKLSDSFILEPNIHFNFIGIGESDELIPSKIKSLVQLVPALDLNCTLFDTVKTGLFIRYSQLLNDNALDKSSVEIGANLSSNGNRGFRANVSYRIAVKKDDTGKNDSGINAGLGYNF